MPSLALKHYGSTVISFQNFSQKPSPQVTGHHYGDPSPARYDEDDAGYSSNSSLLDAGELPDADGAADGATPPADAAAPAPKPAPPKPAAPKPKAKGRAGSPKAKAKVNVAKPKVQPQLVF